ncbi:cyclophilin family peptidyl-prolyl cis-trans isomerase Cyp7 [Schizosaccharomyces cryophilus OY26]|uniref:Cyclophilin family peptidyl-prolyl cis-trans isomerase Cyp7 n=1 Tax=Schizosaccharomyces cryophilus (strain OY26 / ATCC MYA-4695 / CBS 11777 / NBRC 106824 / NRRL Y48691) TaxID=653667 RepID=S9W8M9_SCHCR|nr:cyclophilin family peptidyl-prolyl cis-trans isomerase Cyp7 [Schizosaccharomyces cryophilus OY26]EPY54245.1 cyclophilin family peptidyl-prolyl cis-trans isomerase Cyp7 [Schizosaccharomyces cryophilus OY26]
MATLTNLEPFATGRAVLKTTRGDIQLELWCKEVPKACRNFLQLCMEGYYDNTIFHRVVPDFLIQGGDPTGTGMGGQSIYEDPFPIETHPRLRFMRRGLLGMASTEGEGNQSQFFITLGPTPELNGKQTLFGRVVGETIYNVVRISELELDADERPVYPPKIMSTEIIDSYFTDLKPRSTKEDRERLAKQYALEEKKKDKSELLKKGVRNKAVLSFGDELDMPIPKKPLRKNPLVDQKKQKDLEDKPPQSLPYNADSIASSMPPLQKKPAEVKSEIPAEKPVGPSSFGTSDSSKSNLQKEISALKTEINSMGSSPVSMKKPDKNQKKRNTLEEELEKYKSSKKVLSGKRKKLEANEDVTLSMLSNFQAKIKSVDTQDNAEDTQEINVEEPCSLHNVSGCYSCFDRLGETNASNEENGNWFAHTLIAKNDNISRTEALRKQREEEFKDVSAPVDTRNEKRLR